MSARLLLLVSGLASALGCGAPAARSVPPPEPGVLTVVLDDRLAWPYELERIHLAIDGELFYLRAGGPFARVLASTPAARGEHTVAVQADVAYATGAVGDTCVVRLRSSKSFDAPEGEGSVQVALSLRDVTHDFVERPDIRFELRGLRPFDEARHVPLRRHPRSCPPIDGSEGRICAAEERVRQAREDRDLIALTCYSEKLTRMRSLARLIEERREEVAASESEDEAEHHRRVIAVAEERIERLWQELEACICVYPVAATGPMPTDRQVHGEGCRGTEPLGSERPVEGSRSF